MKEAEDRSKALEGELMPLLLKVPQPPDEDVPVGKDAADNVVLYRWGEPKKFSFKPKSHIEIGEALGLFDFERGVRLAGSRSYFLKGLGAELHAAVLRLATDMPFTCAFMRSAMARPAASSLALLTRMPEDRRCMAVDSEDWLMLRLRCALSDTRLVLMV